MHTHTVYLYKYDVLIKNDDVDNCSVLVTMCENGCMYVYIYTIMYMAYTNKHTNNYIKKEIHN